MANENKFEQAKGDIKKTAGDAVDSDKLKKEGKEDKASGKIKEAAENAKDKAEDIVDKFKK